MGSKLQLYKGFIFSLVFIKFQDFQNNHLWGYAITHDKITGDPNCQINDSKSHIEATHPLDPLVTVPLGRGET